MKRKIIFIFLCLTAMTATIYAQLETNKQELERISVEQNLLWEEAQIRVKAYAEEHNVELRTEFEDGRVIALVDVREDGVPVYLTTHNLGAANTTHASALWENANFGGGITGAGFDKVAVWDGGRARLTHQDFNNTGTPRVTAGDNYTTTSAHATHVTGTIVGAGLGSQSGNTSKGAAYEASLRSYYWDNAESEMAAAASEGFLISNHSYGYGTGWSQDGYTWEWQGDPSISAAEDYNFGFYSSTSRSWDQISFNAPYFLIVTSAGNDRGEGPSYAGTGSYAEKDGGADGYDCIAHMGIAKNVLTVGAVSKVSNYTGPSSVSMSSFSCWGPADDGRIKPDIVGAGVNLYSATNSGNSSYTTMSGTSMASPNVTGSLVLLHHYYEQLYETTMRSSTIKGLAIHTAEECGSHEGPDYRFGWGLLNVEKGAQLIKDKAEKNTIDELILNNGQTFERTVVISQNEPFRATICWIDPAGTQTAPALNDRTPKLINDLDLKITDASGNAYYPYKLNPDNPSAAATKNSTNDVDNVEQVYIAAPTPGEYKIIINHKGSLQGASQAFSLITSYEGTWKASDDATLSRLAVGQGTLTPAFDPDITDYSVQVSNGAMNLSITGTANHPGATVTGNGSRPIEIGENHFEILVTAEDGETTKTYNVTVIRTYLITATSGSGGSITPKGKINVVPGETQTFTFTPNDNYTIADVLVDGESVPSAIQAGSYTFAEVAENHTIAVSFEKNPTYIISALATGEGTISPEGDVEVEHGADQTFTFTPTEGYQVGDVIVDDVIIENIGNTYTFENVTEAHKIEVVFEIEVGIDNVETSSLAIYPNPTNGELKIKNEESKIKDIQVFDVMGRLIREVRNIDNTEFVLDISDFSEGVYFINVDGKTVKVVKQ